MRNHPAMGEFQKTVREFSDEESGILIVERQLTYHRIMDCDQNLNVKGYIPVY